MKLAYFKLSWVDGDGDDNFLSPKMQQIETVR